MTLDSGNRVNYDSLSHDRLSFVVSNGLRSLPSGLGKRKKTYNDL
jgi:hypothetical protein